MAMVKKSVSFTEVTCNRYNQVDASSPKYSLTGLGYPGRVAPKPETPKLAQSRLRVRTSPTPNFQMDPASILHKVVHEVALDGVYGMEEKHLWSFLDHWLPQPLDDRLKQAIWQCIEASPELNVETDEIRTLYASTEAQWTVLTGLSPIDNPVGEKTFEVLSLVAHCREKGITAVDISKKTGQDARLLFSRAQVLVNLGLVQRFPVVENGYSTNRIIFHEWASTTNLGQKLDPNLVDKTLLYDLVLGFVAQGPQKLQLMRTVVQHVQEHWPQIPRPRVRNLVEHAVRELSHRQCLRKVMVVDPQDSEKRYSCVEFLKVAGTRSESPTVSGIVSADGLISPDVEDDDDDETDLDALKTEFNEILGQNGAEPGIETKSHLRANLVFPLMNQIFDLIREAGKNGISAMDLHRRLTGPKYIRILGWYLELLTAAKKPVIPQLEYLTLVKGVDFNRRVKYYRYFTKMAYSGETNARWGEFLPKNLKRAIVPSLMQIEHDLLTQPVRLNCMIVRKDGILKPIFRGDMNLGADVEIILKSDPRKQTNPVRKRGRPRKNPEENKPPEKPQVKSSEPTELDKSRDELKRHAIPMNERKMVGGNIDHESRPSIYLVAPGEDPRDEAMVVDSSEKPSPQHSKVGSLAMQQRIDTFFLLLNKSDGVIRGGQWLMDRYNELCDGDSLIDRRTINRLISNMVSDGQLGHISVSVPGVGANVNLKNIYYDTKTVKDADHDHRILALKSQILNSSRDTRSMASRVAADLAKAAIPVKEVSEDQLNVLKPPGKVLPGRIMSVGKAGRESTGRRKKYGPSASEVLGVDSDGNPHAKRSRKASKAQSVQSQAEKIPITDSAPVDIDPELISGVNSGAVTDSISQPVPEQLDLDELIRRVIVYKSLTPRRGSAIDWRVVVSGLGASPAEANKKWPEARKTLMEMCSKTRSSDAVMSQIEKFEDMFVDAFNRGEVQLPETDLSKAVPELVKWWAQEEAKQAELAMADEAAALADPNVRIAQMTRRLQSLKLKPRGELIKDPLSNLQLSVSVVNAEKLLNETPFSIPLRMIENHSDNFSDVELRVRAVIAADVGSSFSSVLAAQELSGVNDDEVKSARSALEMKRVIQWADSDPTKIPVGRPYVLSDTVLATLSIPKTDSSVFFDAAKSICEVFATSPCTFPLYSTIDETQVITILEIVTTAPDEACIKRYGERFGMITNDYKSRDIDKQAFECNLEFTFQSQQKSRTPLESVEPPTSSEITRPFIWQTKFLRSSQIWHKIVAKVFSLILFRPGIKLDVIAYNLRTALEFRETEAALNAMAQAGILDCPHGYLVSPHWFYSMVVK